MSVMSGGGARPVETLGDQRAAASGQPRGRERVRSEAGVESARVDREWQESLKLTMKLMAFREQLPTAQQTILDGIMRRAQLATAAGLTEVAGYAAGGPQDEIARRAALLDDYFARADGAATRA